MISITPTITIDESEIKLEFIRASGPGGQNVNKVATAVLLRFSVNRSSALTAGTRSRLIRLAGKRIAADGTLIIKAQRYRTQERNRQDALERLIRLIRKAAQKPKPRRKTRPPKASKQRRLADKRHRGAIKRSRRSVDGADE
jgi:ribosome-associated protein